MPKCCRITSMYLPCVPQRYVMCALTVSGALAGWMMYLSAYNTLQEIIASPYEHEEFFRSYRKNRCYNEHKKKASDLSVNVKTYWSRFMKRGVIQAFWIPFTISNILSGIVVDTVGPRFVWSVGVLLSSAMAALLPLSPTVGPYAVLACYCLFGAGLGVLFPCSSSIVAHWVPESERTTIVAFIESTMLLGLIIDLFLHKRLSAWGGWERWLYMSCIISLVWLLLWCTLFYNRPEQHPNIPPGQLRYLQTRTPGFRPFLDSKNKYIPVIPWKNILSSPSVLSLLLYSIASTWVQSILGYQINKYVTSVFNLTTIQVQGVDVTGMALVAGFGSLVAHGWISDRLISSGLTSRTTNRRFLLLFSNYISAVLMIAISFLQCNTSAVIMVIFMLIHVQGMALASMIANVVDISPRYAGLLRGLLGGSRAMASIACRRLVEFLVEDPSDYTSWARVFQISAVIVIVFSSPYLCFGTGNIQTWNYFSPVEERRTASGSLLQTVETKLLNSKTDSLPVPEPLVAQ